MRPFEKCPVCGRELVAKRVEKLVRGGVHTAVLTVPAEVCLRCGERLYSAGAPHDSARCTDRADPSEHTSLDCLGSIEVPPRL